MRNLILVATLLLGYGYCASPALNAQAYPDNPAPQPPAPPAQSIPSDSSSSQAIPAPVIPDWQWHHIQQLPRGEHISVSTNYGPSVRCRFNGATDASLFCSPTSRGDDPGFQFERASVTAVIVDRHDRERDWHPGWISATMAGGILVGFIATVHTDAGHAAEAGLVGALCTGAIAAPMVLLHDDFAPRPYGGPMLWLPLRTPRFRLRR